MARSSLLCFRRGGLGVGGRSEAIPLDEPISVVDIPELDQRVAELRDGIKGPDPEQGSPRIWMKRSAQPLSSWGTTAPTGTVQLDSWSACGSGQRKLPR